MFSRRRLPSNEGSVADHLVMDQILVSHPKTISSRKTHGLIMLMYSGARAQIPVHATSSAKILVLGVSRDDHISKDSCADVHDEINKTETY